jgi:ATP-dependent DNA helicase RecQ
VVFHNSTLVEIAARRPATISELAAVPGVGPAKLERYGRDVLLALAS